MRKGVGIATSVVLTGGLYAQQAEEGIVNLWGLVFSAVLAYWLGHGLVAGFQSMRSSSPQPSAAVTPEAGTRTSDTPSRHHDSRKSPRRPEMPRTGSKQVSNRPKRMRRHRSCASAGRGDSHDGPSGHDCSHNHGCADCDHGCSHHDGCADDNHNCAHNHDNGRLSPRLLAVSAESCR